MTSEPTEGRGAVSRRAPAISRWSIATDRQITDGVCRGSSAALAELYERYRRIALVRAFQVLPPRHRVLADDVVAVAFADVSASLVRQGLRLDDIKPYLLVAVRREAWRQQRRRERERFVEPLRLADDLASDPADEVGSGAGPASAVPGGRTASVDDADPDLLLVEAFANLNERFRRVLWQTEVEGRTPAELAEGMGLTANAVAALLYRARRSFRESYLEAYAAIASSPRCRSLAPTLVAWVVAGRPVHGYDDEREHLGECGSCRDLVRGTARLADPRGWAA